MTFILICLASRPCECVVVSHLPCGDDRMELWPAFDGFFQGLNLGDVGHLLIEAAKGLIVVDVVCHMVNEIFEVREGALEIGFNCRDVLQRGSAV
jgi:hypothetical protein